MEFPFLSKKRDKCGPIMPMTTRSLIDPIVRIDWIICGSFSSLGCGVRKGEAGLEVGCQSYGGYAMNMGISGGAGKRLLERKTLEAALVVAGIGLASLNVLSPTLAWSSEAAAVEPDQEGSVLVATREAPTAKFPPTDSDTTNDGADEESDRLEPISQTSDHAPELANPPAENKEENAAQFGAALIQAAQPAKDEKQAKQEKKRDLIKRSARRTVTNKKSENVPFEPAKFNGIQVGQSTNRDVIAAWGEPAGTATTEEGTVLTYNMEPFEAIEVLVSSDSVVMAVKVALSGALEPSQLAQQLSMSEIEAVTVTDETGTPLGQAFPERGVLFMFATAGKASIAAEKPGVTHVVIQPLDAKAFALRAESHLHGPYQQNIRDLKIANAIDPDLAQAHWLLSDIYIATGQADLAESESSAACSLEPKNASYQLRHSRALALSGQYDEAVREVRAVLDCNDVPPIVRAQALHEMARLASLGDAQIATKAIPFENKAIEIADKLATSTNVKERRAAKQLLVEAHLAIAEEVSRQAFNKKVDSLTQWIGRASGIAEDYINQDGGSVELRLLVAQSALASLASFKPTLDPSPWVTEAEDASKSLFQVSDDPMWQQRVKWELGIAYTNALRVEHLRRETSEAMHYGQSAIENLAEGAASRQAVHSSEQLVGQVYFQMGAAHAILEQDHAKAAQWYDKAAPLLSAPRPVSELYSPRREGEMLVSMGVTYWQLGQQSRALEVTQSGTDLIELAVEDGILSKAALVAPYGNLSTMFEQMGEDKNAAKYADLAKTASSNDRSLPKVARTTAAKMNANSTIQTNNVQQPQTASRQTSQRR